MDLPRRYSYIPSRCLIAAGAVVLGVNALITLYASRATIYYYDRLVIGLCCMFALAGFFILFRQSKVKVGAGTNDNYVKQIPRPLLQFLQINLIVVVNGFVTLFATNPRFDHWVRAIFGVMFVVLAFLAFLWLVRILINPSMIELAEDAILLPNGLLQKEISRVPYSDIKRAWETEGVNIPHVLHLATAERKFEIPHTLLPNLASYQEVRDFLYSLAPIVGKPVPFLTWEEPKDYIRYREYLHVSQPRRPRLYRALIFFARCYSICFLFPAILLVICVLYLQPSIFSFWKSIAPWLAGVPVALFITWVCNWIWHCPPSTISFYDDAIFSRIPNGQSANYRYQDFLAWAIIERPFEDRTLRILLLKFKRPIRVLELALSDGVTRDQLAQIFQNKHIPESPGLKPSWE